MNKTLLIQAILDALREDFESFRQSSKLTRSVGSDAESKSEGKYDTRSTEENYLADGLAKQALHAAESAASIEKLPLATYEATTPIDLGALIHLQFPDEKAWFFLAPAGGGTEVVCEGQTVTVLTPEAPLGGQLLEKKVGDKIARPKAIILAVE